MKEIKGNTGGKKAQDQVCRVSYILNNEQPVRSTIIGDRPFFYMDFDCGADEEKFIDGGEFAIFESEIESLKNDIQAFEKYAEKFTQSPNQVLMDFESAQSELSSPVSFAVENTEIRDVTNLLRSCRTGKAYLDFADSQGVILKYSAQVDGAAYERKGKAILVNPALDTADRILLAARELRRHWQHRQGALINPLLFHPDKAVLVNRAQNADLAVAMVRIAWELQLSGYKDAWMRIENSSMADLGRSLAQEAFMDFRTLNNGQASAAVFESWFLSERCRNEDRKLIKQMLADYQGYVFDNDSARKNITPSLISALGAMPFGKNYLAQHAPTILADPVFTDVRDRSNANFLWFIKFERSFRESEQELQSLSEPAASGVRSKAPSQQDANYEKGIPSAEIIRLFPEERKDGDKESASGKILPPKTGPERIKGKNKSGAKIVYLRRWSRK